MIHQKIPIAVFVYNRPDHTHALFSSLTTCSGLDDCRVHIFCDGPASPKHEKAVEATRRLVEHWVPKIDAQVTYQTRNLGLARSVVDGVTQLCDAHGKVIVLEDDLVLHRNFLNFMTAALAKYECHPEVYQISGFSFPLAGPFATDTYFLPLTTTWGWATWRRAWQHFCWDPADAAQMLSDPIRRYRFDLEGTYPYSNMLEAALRMQVSSWGVRWQYAIFQAGGIVLYPRKSLVWNGGFDDSGIHGQAGSANWQSTLTEFRQEGHPDRPQLTAPLESDKVQFARLKSFISRSRLSRRAPLWTRLATRLGRMFGQGSVKRRQTVG